MRKKSRWSMALAAVLALQTMIGSVAQAEEESTAGNVAQEENERQAEERNQEAEKTYEDFDEMVDSAASKNVTVFNNGGLYVKSGKETYYWQTDEGSFENEAIFGNFTSYPLEHTNTMMCIIENPQDENGSEIQNNGEAEKKQLFSMNSVKNIFVMNDRFYLERATSTPMQMEIISVDKNGEDLISYGKGAVLAVDEQHSRILFERLDETTWKKEMEFYSLDKGQVEASVPFSTFLGVFDGVIYYEQENGDNQNYLMAVDGDGTNERVILELTFDLYNFWGLQGHIQHVQMLDDQLYFSIGSYAGTGNFYQGGEIIRVAREGGTPEILAGAAGSEYSSNCWDNFCVYEEQMEKDGEKDTYTYLVYQKMEDENVCVKNLDTGEEVTQTGVVGNLEEPCWDSQGQVYYQYLQNGEKQILIVPSDYEQDSMGATPFYQEDALFEIRDVEVLENWVYYTTEYSIHNKEGDIGWRYNYVRQKTKTYRKNLEDQTIELLWEY